MRKILVAIVMWLISTTTCMAAVPADFTYNGVKLDDSYDVMVRSLGESIVDMSQIVNGQPLVYYYYKHSEVQIGINKETGRVADIIIRDKNYTTWNDIKLGATPHKLLKVYGSNQRQRVDKKTCYVYLNPENSQEKLCLNVGDGYLEEFRITNLELVKD